jgi:F420H(2)-dependent quinone reductase
VTESSGPNNWNQKIIEEFRANAGRVGGYFEGAPMLLIHHIGALTVEVGTATFAVDATEVKGEERNELWRRLVELRPGFGAYETKTITCLPNV